MSCYLLLQPQHLSLHSHQSYCCFSLSTHNQSYVLVIEMFQDVAPFESANGKMIYLPNSYLACSTDSEWLMGIAALGKAHLGFPSQLDAAFGLDKKFAIRLRSSTTSSGVILLGTLGNYVTKSLIRLSTPTLAIDM